LPFRRAESRCEFTFGGTSFYVQRHKEKPVWLIKETESGPLRIAPDEELQHRLVLLYEEYNAKEQDASKQAAK
jgi:hypothetical protein